jgi:transcriptional regulator with XRE-family HTH domain
LIVNRKSGCYNWFCRREEFIFGGIEMDNSSLGKRIEEQRKMFCLTQAQLAGQIGVTPQAVSSWERGETAPDIDKLSDLADRLHTTVPYLLDGKNSRTFHDKLFNEEHMYTYIRGFATSRQMMQTLRALPFARDCHKGQVRKGQDGVPYIVHPLNMACHALSLGITDDNIVAAALLHDVCEDCGVLSEDLPVNETVRSLVAALTKTVHEGESREQATARYYGSLKGNTGAELVKLLDRCNNVSFMAYSFSREKLQEYITETRKYILPLIEDVKKNSPEYGSQLFLLKYHICSVIGSIEASLEAE